MESKLKLREIQHKQIWERREAIQTKFKVQINSPFAFSDSSETQLWMYNGFRPFGYVMISIQGEIADVAAAKVDSAMDKSKPPVIENSAFIPFSQKSANASSGQAPGLRAKQPAAEAKARHTEAVPESPTRLRPVVIDGCNVAFYCSQGRREEFSWKRIEKCMQFFLDRGHTDVKVFLPQSRRPICYEKSGNQQHVENLENQHLIVFTPSRRIEGKTINCYDDRFIVDYAFRTGGIIVSNDNYRDLMIENLEWAKTIKDRLLMYVFAGDELMIPEDPLGQKGPRLNEFLAF